MLIHNDRCQATNGTILNIRTHLKGLQRMVVLRGGLQEATINPYTIRLVLWYDEIYTEWSDLANKSRRNRADLNCAIAMGTNPGFLGLETNLGDDQPGHLSNPHAVASGQPATLNKETSVNTLNVVLKESFDNLKSLAEIKGKKRNPTSIDKEDSKTDSDILFRTERSLLILSNIWGPRKFVTAGCLAAIIFIDNQLRGISFRAQIMDRVVERLHHTLDVVLDDIPQHDLKENAARAILWSLVVGAISADYRSCRGWFVERTLDFSDALGLQTWEETKKILEGFLWPVAWHTQGHILWNEVEERRLMKYTMIPEVTAGNDFDAGDALEWV